MAFGQMIPFSSWLPDAYPEATVLGGVVLSAYTSKTAVYTLARGFAGWDILIGIGCAMAIYGVIYALLENNFPIEASIYSNRNFQDVEICLFSGSDLLQEKKIKY